MSDPLRRRADSQTIIGEFPSRHASLIHSQSTGSDITLGFISRHLALCDAAHAQTCLRSFRGSSAPTRLLEISDDRIRLVELGPFVEVKYVCLAHRWATRQPWDDEADKSSAYSISMRCRTLRSNLSQRKADINLHDLLPTYQDAISVTIRMGINHLWIDSLCIVQDDEDDVRLQIARMGGIYGNSYFTIAADTLNDHTRSFFSNRRWRWRTHEEVVVDSHGFSHKLFFRERPKHAHLGWDGLFDRAWWVTNLFCEPMITTNFVLCRCFQERLLSPRIIRFQADEVIFECNEGLICECGNPPAGHQGPWEDISKSAHLHDKVAFNTLLSPTSKESTTDSWHHLVHAYSRTRLTRESDRMNAFAGIVSLYHERSMSHSQYLAGLWSHSLWSDLLWSVTSNNSRLPDDRLMASTTIPSWSWMSISLGGHSIAYPKHRVQQTFPRLNKIHYEPLSINLPLGDVAPGAYLEIEGQLMQVPASHYVGIKENSFRNVSPAANVKWDLGVLECRVGDSLFLLRMAYLRQDPVVKEAFLILLPRRHSTEEKVTGVLSFTRIGYLEVPKDELQSFSEDGLRPSEDCQVLRLY